MRRQSRLVSSRQAATNWIGSTVYLYDISFSGLLAFLWVNVEYKTIFLLWKEISVFVKSLHTWYAHPIIFCHPVVLLFQGAICASSLTFWVRGAMELQNSWVSRWRAHEHRCSTRSSPIGLVCLSESHRGLNFRDAISERRYLCHLIFVISCSVRKTLQYTIRWL